MDNTQPQVQTIRQINSFGPAGNVVASYAVTFAVGTHGPFTITVPQSDFNAQTIRQKIAEFAQTITAIAQGQ